MFRHLFLRKTIPVLFFSFPLLAQQQQQESVNPKLLQQILDRLSTLEEQNRQLIEQVRSLKEQLHPQSAEAGPANANSVMAPSAPPIEERVTVNEGRIAEQAQTKVESSQKFPIRLTGMLLFNAFDNSHYGAGESAADYGLLTGPAGAGATFRQTLLGLEFDGPHLPGNGRVSGDLMMDFWAGYPDPGGSWIRLRQARVSLDWANRSFSVGQDQPLISPHQPDSLAEVGVPPLAGAGNLWQWLPQARYEERFHLGSNNGITAQAAVIQTEEGYNSSIAYPVYLEKARPGIEGRAAFWHKFDDTRRIEIGGGFHFSASHIAGQSVNSHIGSFDWLASPERHFQISGTFFDGDNIQGLGTFTNGFAFDPEGRVLPVHSRGGWTQFAFPITDRLTLNIFGGMQHDQSEYLLSGATWRNFTYASNVVYRLGPNLLLSAEALQVRANNVGGSRDIHNHYDVAIGYLF
ncbi:MAG TPA: hypothetical protein VH351_07210 [Bryobacteraceae bacterium]|jgi:hypothetical protein|nr:hypothetical protein [Bryobacteraceae bacterium]